MSSAAIERRAAPRFAVRCSGELASGTTVTAVVISDMSVTGCGVEVSGRAVGEFGCVGVLSIAPAQGTTAPVLLPVTISDRRADGAIPRLGLQFRPLSVAQMRGLVGVMDGAIER